ncbi:MAG TPA: carboxypeptidase-like regulatory domain-containing protein, partial [Acidimicrobiales bacterium]|nr:carboxypeptidase-like regulatory domain-containing protein [Acidimicrobiales bacterium]
AREKLRRALVRRGVVLPASVLAAVLDARPASASISSPLCDITTRAALQFAAGPAVGGALAASTAALAQEVLRSMLIHKLKLVGLTLLVLGAVATGAGYDSLAARAQSREGALHPSRERERAVSPATGALPLPDGRGSESRPSPDPAAARMTIVGRVLDPSGNPLPGARVAVLADRKRLVSDLDGRPHDILMGTAAVDTDGRFRLEFPAIPAKHLHDLKLIASAPGRGLGMVELKADAASQEASIALVPEKAIEGRLVDVQGQPAAGVVIRLASVNVRPELQPYDAKGAPSLWPPPVTTDADGRFRWLGLGPDVPATFQVDDPRFARQAFALHKRSARISEAEIVVGPNATVTLRPAQALDVHIVHADDGRPVAGARVDIESTAGRRPTLFMGKLTGA